METRRNFVRKALTGFFSVCLSVSAVSSVVAKVMAVINKTVVPKGAKRESLVDKNPKDLDTTNLEVTRLEDFGTMGLENHDVALDKWRLIVDGEVEKPLSLTYAEVLALPSIQRTVLLICPGIFVNNGAWKGVSVKELFKLAGMKSNVTHVTFRGPEGNYQKTHRVPLDHALVDKSFLAYEVNGQTLPQKHGFPVRLVAEEYFGDDWVKYVYRVTAEAIAS